MLMVVGRIVVVDVDVMVMVMVRDGVVVKSQKRKSAEFGGKVKKNTKTFRASAPTSHQRHRFGSFGAPSPALKWRKWGEDHWWQNWKLLAGRRLQICTSIPQ